MRRYLFFLLLLLVFIRAEGASTPSETGAAPIPFTFNPLSVKRDPFLAPEIEERGNISELQRYEIAQLQLVGVMQGLGPTKAMIVSPTKKTFIVQTGDNVGRNNGVITRITDSEVHIKESFRDFQGRIRTENVRMALAL